MTSNNKSKLIVILGRTATGKSDVGVDIALTFDGEIISADSRQVYKGLDLGTGKITRAEMKGVPHYLLDVENPKKRFTAFEYKKLAEEKIQQITERGHVPILVGGTGFYIDTVVSNMTFPEVAPNEALRKELEEKSIDELYSMLIKIDPSRSQTVDIKNKRRLIRAIEIATELGSVPSQKKESPYDVLLIGLRIGDDELKSKIKIRLKKRMYPPAGGGMIDEARILHNPPTGGGLSWKRMDELGLEYKYMALYLRKKITEEEFIDQLATAIWQYARRQNTWFKRNKKIHWFNPTEIVKIEALVKDFLK
ncbi:tRNA (adenosine(37)-N6)-dimethylallyltransferase MiaA [Candidatus Wolfebacteria bacterium]|nr:MAG: tRNA (adenosine(37)-N6)-dimethylallyltransferase MiaA [Candidatus Wolfebacteria bacterium]